MNEQEQDEVRVAERAAQWQARLEAGDAATQSQFMAWLEESPRHVRHFLLAQALDVEAAAIDPERKIDARALWDASNANVVPLQGARSASPSKVARRGVRVWAWASGIAAAAAGLLFWLAPWSPHTYETAVGEQRTLALEDGSVIDLNMGSRVELHFSGSARDVELLEGEAMFKVAPDRTRPFRVHAGVSTIQALGTQFNVNRLPSGMTVSVIEGAVRVSGAEATASAKLGAGEQIRVAKDGKLGTPSATSAGVVPAWRERRLVFEEDTLEDIAAEFNRYNRAPKIVIADGAAGARRYGGIFNADDPRSLAEFVAGDGRLAVEAGSEEIVIRERAR